MRYHNAFTIGLLLVFIVSASVFAASPAAREAVIEDGSNDNSFTTEPVIADSVDTSTSTDSVATTTEKYEAL